MVRPRAGPEPVFRMDTVRPAKAPGARCPLWSAPLGTSDPWVTVRRAAAAGPQPDKASVLSSRALSPAVRTRRGPATRFVNFVLCSIRKVGREPDAAFL